MFMRRFKIQDSRFGEGEWKDTDGNYKYQPCNVKLQSKRYQKPGVPEEEELNGGKVFVHRLICVPLVRRIECARYV